MAFVAGAPELTLMLVVAAVAAIARGWRRHLHHGLASVTGMARQAGMSAGQGKGRLPIMIEAPAGPAVRVVAGRAGRTQATLMVRVFVTSRAGLGYILE